MSKILYDLLNQYREQSETMREKGTYFEKLVKVFLTYDPLYKQNYNKIYTYEEWARLNNKNAQDTGIDLVAKNADDDCYTAIQCKFYGKDKIIQKADIDSFFTASGARYFSKRLFVDATVNEWGKNALNALENQHIPCTRINLQNLEQSPIDWQAFLKNDDIRINAKKTLRPHQQDALENVKKGFAGGADRGKLIMACGTGKTFTSLKIAENIIGNGGLVLYLVPSLALMGQTIREWANDSELTINAYATCSDSSVGKRKAGDDNLGVNIHDLAYPATTNAESLAKAFKKCDDKMNVVYTTYQSLDVIQQAQADYHLPAFDLIICDEAHRTTGATADDKSESNFVKIHDNKKINGKRRLYMTATPKVYNAIIKEKAHEAKATLMSMDDRNIYGDIFHIITFDDAVQKDLLCDYKVVVFAVDQNVVSASLQNRLKDENNEISLDDASKIIGCYKALTKQDIANEVQYDNQPIKSALAFCNSIKSSKYVTEDFQNIVNEYRENITDKLVDLSCNLDHVDGTMNSPLRHEKLQWLANPENDECRILSNMRCLSEGVDVPSLDAVLFMHPRKSQIDIVQAVGRVMRKAEGKKMGYVIIPVGIAPNDDPAAVLDNHEKYKTIWQVLNALRSHDERLDAKINQGALGVDISDKISIYITSNNLPASLQNKISDRQDIKIGCSAENTPQDKQKNDKSQFEFVYDEIHNAIINKIVDKCGNRFFWYDWAKDIAKIAENHITQLQNAIIQDSDLKNQFDKFLDEIRDDLNDNISQEQAIEMLAQHLITKPVFDALFHGHEFTKLNPVSRALDGVLNELKKYNFNPETQGLTPFYQGVRNRVADIKDAKAKQKLIIQLYDNFFKGAFKATTEQLGIVYTPIEVVDFIIHSVNDILKDEFNQTLGSEGVHIIDPFTGTGSFIVRLIESGLITNDQLIQKFTRKNRFNNNYEMTEIHANEIILLAYYIASINIEQAYHGAVGGEYKNFQGLCLTDTFQLHEGDDMIQRALQDNSQRRVAQKSLNAIQVIIGNPPYNVGKGVDYKLNTQRITDSYAKYSTATNKNSLYDSYIRAIRWASDRIGNHGVIGFVTGSGFMQKPAMDGLRKCLADEFTSLYIFNLRGDMKKQMLSGGVAKEGGNIFGQNSQSGIAISILVKNQYCDKKGQIYYYDIGDDLKTIDKLNILTDKKTIKNLSWQIIKPNKYNDWIEQRDSSLNQYMLMGSKDSKKKNSHAKTIFNSYSSGLKTNRDAWCYNSSYQKLSKNMQNMINFYNDEVKRYENSDKNVNIKNFVNNDSKRIKWNDTFYNNAKKANCLSFNDANINTSLYRPFNKENLYFAPILNEGTYLMPRFFPEQGLDNLVIGVSGVGGRSGFSCLISDKIPCLDYIEKGQCFPLKIYERQKRDDKGQDDLLGNANDYIVKHGVSDAGLAYFQENYKGEDITKDDIFYYIYGILHSHDYRTKFANNLTKELPRIPCVKSYDDYRAFVKAGRELADLHLFYENGEKYHVTFNCDINSLSDEDFHVKKMKHGKMRDENGKQCDDKSIIIYNEKITIGDIPLDAYDYMVNGKSAIKWVMERQGVKIDKDSGIVNDANDYAIETMKNPRYPLELLQRIIALSLKTIKIVQSLPAISL